MSPTSRPGLIAGLPPGTFSGLFQAVDGLRNLRAFVAMLGCMVVGVLVAGFCSVLASHLGFAFGFLGGLAMFVASAVGANAAGVLLMDQARGLPLRSLERAIRDGLACIPKFILLGLSLTVVALVVFVVIALAYLVCKIPLIGPLLFVVVFPVSVVLAGLTSCGLFICLFLALPAIWEGAPILSALTQALAIARSRLVESLLMLVVVGVLASLVGFIVFAVLFSGLVPTVTMAASMFGGGAVGSMIGSAALATEAGSSYGMAAGIGGMLLWALTGTLSSLVYLLGLAIVYLRVIQGLDLHAAEGAVKAGLDQARRQAADLGQKARDGADRAREAARRAARPAAPSPADLRATQAGADDATTIVMPVADPTVPSEMRPEMRPEMPPAAPRPTRDAPPESTTPAVAKALTCPHCLSAVGKDDVYCGVCGYKL